MHFCAFIGNNCWCGHSLSAYWLCLSIVTKQNSTAFQRWEGKEIGFRLSRKLLVQIPRTRKTRFLSTCNFLFGTVVCLFSDFHHVYFWFQRANKSKNSVEKEKSSSPDFSTLETISTSQHLPPPPVVQTTEIVDEQSKYAYSVEDANTSSYVPAVEAPEVVTEVVRPTPVTRFTGMSREEVAAIRIQTTFRGYLVYVFLHALLLQCF